MSLSQFKKNILKFVFLVKMLHERFLKMMKMSRKLSLTIPFLIISLLKLLWDQDQK